MVEGAGTVAVSTCASQRLEGCTGRFFYAGKSHLRVPADLLVAPRGGDGLSTTTRNRSRTRGDVDSSFMDRAFELAERGRGATSPNPVVGAVIVKDGEIVGVPR